MPTLLALVTDSGLLASCALTDATKLDEANELGAQKTAPYGGAVGATFRMVSATKPGRNCRNRKS
jgi:hypothetical protein